MDQLLSENDIKERLSLVYIQSIASRCGYCYGDPSLDRDSIDISISAGGNMRPKIDFQLKATSSPQWQGDEVAFSLSRKNYDDLSAKRQTPIYLGLLVLPNDSAQWLQWSEEELIIKNCIYWLSLKDFPPISTERKTVKLPKNQVLNCKSMRELIDQSRGDIP